MRNTLRAGQILILVLIFAQSFDTRNLVAQDFAEQNSNERRITQQKKAVVFIFGAIHPLNPDKTPLTDENGNRVVVEVPLGTGFFVSYEDRRAGSNCRFSCLVTAKHVLQDADGSFLPRVAIRLNLKTLRQDEQNQDAQAQDWQTQHSGVGFISNIPVTDAQGNLLWLHSEDPAQDAVALPLSPDQREFDFETIPVGMFVNDRSLNDRSFKKQSFNEQSLNSGAMAEGDDLYFIGLMTQYYGIKRNYPLVRRGTVALLTDENIDTPTGPQRVIIAELESWPGNSGSPVFLLRSLRDVSRTRSKGSNLVGMIVGSFLNRFSVPVNSSMGRLEAGDAANTGMTSIVPASVIERILDSLPAQQERDARLRGLRGLGGVEATSQ